MEVTFSTFPTMLLSETFAPNGNPSSLSTPLVFGILKPFKQIIQRPVQINTSDIF
jgi:hypothetical protein